jgi:hypothetical protein
MSLADSRHGALLSITRHDVREEPQPCKVQIHSLRGDQRPFQ